MTADGAPVRQPDPALPVLELPPEFRRAVDDALDALDRGDVARRLFRRDATLWPGATAHRALGWVGLATRTLPRVRRYAAVLRTLRGSGFREVVWLGMGGASLFARVAAQVFAQAPGLPMRVLDTTDPDAIAEAEAAVDWEHALVVAASKSGRTLETLALASWAREKLAAHGDPNRRMAYVTDPGSPMFRAAWESGVYAVFPGLPDVGGRFSALTDFGALAAAVAGADVPSMFERAAQMELRCGGGPARENPGLVLGACLAVAAQSGLSYLSLGMSPTLAALAPWVEQLVAESTGKEQKGLLPLCDEPMEAGRAGHRFFLEIASGEAERGGTPVQEARKAGAPVVATVLPGPEELFAETVRWFVAVAACAHLLEIDPFDQPDVEATKKATHAHLEHVTPLQPDWADAQLAVRGDVPEGDDRLAAALGKLLSAIPTGGYLGILAFVPEIPPVAEALAGLRATLVRIRGIPTSLGWGPRYLHASGQFHKGGPPLGAFLVLTREVVRDVTVPDRGLGFGTIQAAQARADADVLRRQGRPVLEVQVAAACAIPDAIARIAEAAARALRSARVS